MDHLLYFLLRILLKFLLLMKCKYACGRLPAALL